jgi:hypothetical protein
MVQRVLVLGLSAMLLAPVSIAGENPNNVGTLVMLSRDELARAHRLIKDTHRATISLPDHPLDPAGPLINVDRPPVGAGPLVSPFELVVEWQAESGSRVDLATLEVYYLTDAEREQQDLVVISATKRIRQCQRLLARAVCRLDESGLRVPKAEFPPGRYEIVLFLADTSARYSRRDFHVEITR